MAKITVKERVIVQCLDFLYTLQNKKDKQNQQYRNLTKYLKNIGSVRFCFI